VTLDQTDHRTAASATVKTRHAADTTTLQAMSDPYEREAAKAAIKVLQRELAEAQKQRDALINILTDVINEDGTAKSIDRAAIFLTAVKGGSDE
jgi:uncharacterized tellurite resistance protein B-like protein